ncbi:MAG: peroxiredoxin [Nitrososphaerota archaeon]|jgi:peroxiredoxin (alkyl hydroperoxide reductase subunit C)|nr:peroxiredoxin [Nitrososphaerota archaeon]MDG7036983.1 peroxiredoxin [Nitrososphaerota archaeon]MDG7038781.1 peroxiredoxin [Nitrososphaerota archaeon]MDG7039833.1 peroxiredoxin [Nitrososphaerota archaeon]MDG7042200.1 peroxiredoxin [Nitrososphaerota archaeon]
MLEVGAPAPEFTAKAYFPVEKRIGQISLSDYKNKWVIMTFHPGDFTFVCATDLEGFQAYYDKFKASNAEVLGISTDSVYSHKVWHETSPRVSKVTFPLVDDIKKELSSAYGFLNSYTGMTKRGTVIIDPAGKVQYISVFNDRLGKDVKHIYNAFKGLEYLFANKGTAEEFDIIPANWQEGGKPIKIKAPEDIGKL